MPEAYRAAAAARLGGKRALALREFALASRAAALRPARTGCGGCNECVFGVLALESEPIDPRPLRSPCPGSWRASSPMLARWEGDKMKPADSPPLTEWIIAQGTGRTSETRPRWPVRAPGRRGMPLLRVNICQPDAPSRHRRASLHLAARAGRGRRGGLGAACRGGGPSIRDAVRIHDDDGHAEPAPARWCRATTGSEFPMLERFARWARRITSLCRRLRRGPPAGAADRCDLLLTDAADGFDAAQLARSSG